MYKAKPYLKEGLIISVTFTLTFTVTFTMLIQYRERHTYLTYERKTVNKNMP